VVSAPLPACCCEASKRKRCSSMPVVVISGLLQAGWLARTCPASARQLAITPESIMGVMGSDAGCRPIVLSCARDQSMSSACAERAPHQIAAAIANAVQAPPLIYPTIADAALRKRAGVAHNAPAMLRTTIINVTADRSPLPLTPGDACPHALVQVVDQNLRQNLGHRHRTGHLGTPGNQERDEVGVNAAGRAPTHGLGQRAGVRLSTASEPAAERAFGFLRLSRLAGHGARALYAAHPQGVVGLRIDKDEAAGVFALGVAIHRDGPVELQCR